MSLWAEVLQASPRSWVLALVGLVLAAGASAAYPPLLDGLVTAVFDGGAPGTGGIFRSLAPLRGVRLDLPTIGIALAAVVVVRGLGQWLSVQTVERRVHRLGCDLRDDLHRRLLGAGPDLLRSWGTGRLLDRLVPDVTAVEVGLRTSVLVTLGDVLKVLATGGVLIVLYPGLMAASLVVLPGIAVVVGGFARFVGKHEARALAHRSEVVQRLQESLDGAAIVQGHGAEGRRGDDVLGHLEQHRGARDGAAMVQAAQRPTMELLGAALLLLVVAMADGSNLRPGQTVGFLLGVVLLYEPIKAVARSVAPLAAAEQAALRLRELRERLNPPAVGGPPPNRLAPNLVLSSVSHRHPGSTDWVLRGVNLQLGPGRSVAIVGASGVGKSTLVSMCSGLRTPTSGRIEVDGCAVPAALRAAVAVVEQEPFLFEGTVAENLRLGAPHASDDELRRALRRAEALSFVQTLPKGLDTRLTEGGSNLSGGQRQRLALARAFVRDAPVLVLDEPTSALDLDLERAIRGVIQAWSREHAVMIIAHRSSTVSVADQVMELRDGTLFTQCAGASSELRQVSTPLGQRARPQPWRNSATKQS